MPCPQSRIQSTIKLNKKRLHRYEGPNVPGQMWYAYNSGKKKKETGADKDLRSRLTDLLTPTMTNAELEDMSNSRPNWYCPYLRVHQKKWTGQSGR